MRKTASVVITVLGVMPVQIGLTPASGYAPLDVTLEVGSLNYISTGPFDIGVIWGDGQTENFVSTKTAPGSLLTTTHRYTATGDFTVRVNVHDRKRNADGTASGTVTVLAALAISLTASPTSGNVPLAVTFTTTISGGKPPYALEMDFGDGTPIATGSWPAPGPTTNTHTYEISGIFTAIVTVTDALGASLSAETDIGAGDLIEPIPIYSIIGPILFGLTGIVVSRG